MRTESIVVTVCAVALGVVAVLAADVARAPRRDRAADAPALPRDGSRPLPAPVTITAAAPQPALAGLGDGYAAYADGEGHIVLVKRDGDGLVLRGAYALRRAPKRDLADPERRSPSGFYLDDLGLERERALVAARAAFEKEMARRAVDVEAHARAEARARDVVAAGDATFLVEKLKDPRYTARRAAALVLAENGIAAAAPALEEVIREEAGTADEARARRLLARLREAQ